VVNLFSYIVV